MVEDKIDEFTKNAWKENWKDYSVEKVLEIFNYPRVQRFLDIFLSILPKEGKILEGGCGLGPWLIKLKSLGYDITGVDYDVNCINKIKAYDPKIPVYTASVEETPFENDCFSAYLSLGVLEHFYHGPEKAIKEAFRILKPEGVFIIIVPYLNTLLRLKLPILKLKRNQRIRRLFRKEEKKYYYERYFKPNDLANLLQEEGFKIEEILPVDHIFTWVSFCGIFRDKNSYDGENRLAVRWADFFSKLFPWQTAHASLIIAKKPLTGKERGE